MQCVKRAMCPCVWILIEPGVPPTLIIVSCSARPIVLVLRQRLPVLLYPQFRSIALAAGPLTIGSGDVLCVEVCTASRLNCGAAIAFTQAISTGMYSGAHPAITAFAAIFSMVARPFFGASVPITSPE